MTLTNLVGTVPRRERASMRARPSAETRPVTPHPNSATAIARRASKELIGASSVSAPGTLPTAASARASRRMSRGFSESLSIGPTLAEESPEPSEGSPGPSEESPKPPAEILREMETAFKAMDVNGDGALDNAKVQAAFERSDGPVFSDGALKPILEDLLQKHGGKVDFEQFKDIDWKSSFSPTSPSSSAN